MKLGLEEHLKSAKSTTLSWRKKALARFQEIGLPSRSDDAFQYLPLSQLYQEHFAKPLPAEITHGEICTHCLPECKGQLLVFVNGQFHPELSQKEALPRELVILPLKEAFGPYGQFLQSRLMRALQEEKDPFALLNSALFEQGLFLYIPPKMHLERPLQILHLTTDEHPALLTPRLQLFIGAGSEVNLISETVGKGAHLITDVVDISLEEGAQLRHWHLATPSKESWSFSSMRATLKRDSNYQILTYTRGAKTVRQDFQFSLLGENASVDLKGLAELSEHRGAHTVVLVDHGAPHTRSNQLYKQALADVSQGSFQGKIYVRPIAQKTEAYQLNNNLILAPRAQAYSKPNLEIFADDVKASHGATVSQLDEQQLLYLKTRGLSDEEARLLLVNGFSREILSQIPFSSLLEKISHAG